MKYLIIEARKKIRTFCKVNSINLYEELLETPIEEIQEFVRKRNLPKEDNDWQLSEAEIRYDLSGAKAYFMPYDIENDGKPCIIYDGEAIRKLDDFEQSQIIIHEFLHFADLKVDFGYNNDQEMEAEVEYLSLLIEFYPDQEITVGMKMLADTFSIESLNHYTDDLNFNRQLIRKFACMPAINIKRRLECK